MMNVARPCAPEPVNPCHVSHSGRMCCANTCSNSIRGHTHRLAAGDLKISLSRYMKISDQSDSGSRKKKRLKKQLLGRKTAGKLICYVQFLLVNFFRFWQVKKKRKNCPVTADYKTKTQTTPGRCLIIQSRSVSLLWPISRFVASLTTTLMLVFYSVP